MVMQAVSGAIRMESVQSLEKTHNLLGKVSSFVRQGYVMRRWEFWAN